MAAGTTIRRVTHPPWRWLPASKVQARKSSQTRPAASASGPSSSAPGTRARRRLPWPPPMLPPWHPLMTTTGAACTGTSPGASSARTGSTWPAHDRRRSWSTEEERSSWIGSGARLRAALDQVVMSSCRPAGYYIAVAAAC